MKTLSGILMRGAIVAAGVMTAAAAHADTSELGARLSILPVGTIKATSLFGSISYDTETAYAFGATFDAYVAPSFSIGAAPQLILGIKAEDSNERSARQLDLAVRATAYLVNDEQLRLYGFIAPGYSIIYLPDNGDGDDPSGVILGFGGGVAFSVSPGVALTAELGYQLGFQSVEVLGRDIDFQTAFLHVGLGLRARL